MGENDRHHAERAAESAPAVGSLLTEHVLKKDGCPLHYWIGGQAGRPLVALTHGACADHHSFDPQIPSLAGKYRVLTWDVRGHGQSRPMGQDYSLPLAVGDLLAIVDQVGYRRAAYVGHSNGSYIAQEIAFRQPELVEALVVADGTCITLERSAFEIHLTRLAPRAMALFPFEMLKRSGLALNSSKPEIREDIYRAFSQIPRRDFLIILRAVSDSLHGEPGYRIPVPMLLVHGDDDRLGDIRKLAPIWAAREPDCRYVVIPHARHFALLDNPDFFTSTLLDFLASRVGAPRPGD